MIVDGGSEYQGEVNEFNRVDHRIVKLIAQKDIIQSNSMVEAINKHIKYYYLFKKDLNHYNETVKYLMKSIPDYNLKPHGALFGLTPFEVLEGEVPSRDKFKEQKEQARKERLKQNMKVECCEKK